MNSCARARSLLAPEAADWLEGAERQWLEAHLAQCSNCADESARLHRLWTTAASTADTPVPVRSFACSENRRGVPVAIALCAAVLLAAGALAYLHFRRPDVTPAVVTAPSPRTEAATPFTPPAPAKVAAVPPSSPVPAQAQPRTRTATRRSAPSPRPASKPASQAPTGAPPPAVEPALPADEPGSTPVQPTPKPRLVTPPPDEYQDEQWASRRLRRKEHEEMLDQSTQGYRMVGQMGTLALISVEPTDAVSLALVPWPDETAPQAPSSGKEGRT